MRADHDRLHDILEAIEAIHRYSIKGRDEFDGNELVQVWCLHHILLIGEAASKLSENDRRLSTAIPWRELIGMRNILIHAYFDVSWKRVWSVVANDLAPLKAEIQRLLTLPDISEES